MTAVLFTPQKTSIEVAIYPRAQDPILVRPEGTGPTTPGRFAEGKGPRLVQFSYSKNLGETAVWSCVLKMARSSRSLFEEAYQDDDWVDISLLRSAKRYHLLRGLIRSTQRSRSAGTDGATTVSYTLSGYDHQAVFDLTRVWFNNFSDENLFGGATLRAAGYAGEFYGNPGQTVESILLGFMRVIAGFGRSLWRLPPGLPGVAPGQSFPDVVKIIADDSSNNPRRRAVGAHDIAPSGDSVWPLAQEWSDPQVNELFCDLIGPDDRVISPLDVMAPETTQMGVILRQRPFPTDEDTGGAERSTWASLPTLRVPRQKIQTDDLARRGEERLNIFEAPALVLQETLGTAANLYAPLADPTDVREHGARPLTIQARYVGDVDAGVNDADLSEANRKKLRDWYCLQHLFWSGEIAFAGGLPELRVGMKLEVGDEASEIETFYVEGITHRWNLQSGLMTSALVSRGFTGGDAKYIAAMRERAAGYRLLDKADASAIIAPVAEFIA